MKELNKIKENKVSLETLVLESTGSCVDTNGVTYPLNVDGTPDTNSGVHFCDVSNEWFDSLSAKDYSEFLKWHFDWSLSMYNKESK